MRQTGKITTISIIIIAVIITLVIAMQARSRQLKQERSHSTSEINDFDRWMSMVPNFIQHHANYTNDSFPNPPIVLAIFAPLTWISPPNAQFAWVCCKLIFSTGILLLSLKMARVGTYGVSPMIVLLILATWIWPVLGDMQEGQTNLLMLLPLAGGLYAAQRERSRLDLLAGLLIALAICIKVTPIIFLIYFVYRRRWITAASIVAGMFLWLVLVPGVVFGWRQNMLWLSQWNSIMIVPFLEHARQEYFYGQSISAFLSRLFRHVPAFISHKHSPHPYPQYVNIVNLPGPLCDWFIRSLLGGIGILGLWWMRGPLQTFRSNRYLLDIGAVATFMLWASPRTWVPHFVTLIFALTAVGVVACDTNLPRQICKRAVAALVVCAALMFLTTDIGKIFGRDGHRWIITIAVSLWGSVLLMAIMYRARRFYNRPACGIELLTSSPPHRGTPIDS